jgi:hypothetical protein
MGDGTMKRISVVLVCIFSIIILVSCNGNKNQTIVESHLLNIVANIVEMNSDKTLMYVGESNNWEITLIVKENESGKRKSEYIKILRYRGKIDNSLTQVKNDEFPITHKIYFPDGSTGGKAYLSEDGTFFGGGGSGSHRLNSESTLEAVLEWDGKKEEIQLSYKNITTFSDLYKKMDRDLKYGEK